MTAKTGVGDLPLAVFSIDAGVLLAPVLFNSHFVNLHTQAGSLGNTDWFSRGFYRIGYILVLT